MIPDEKSPPEETKKRAVRALARLLLAAGIFSVLAGIVGFGSGFVLSFGGAGLVPADVELPLSEPEAAAVLPDGRVLVGLMFYGRVQEYGADGNFRRGWFVPGTEGGHFLMRRGKEGMLEALTLRSNILHRFSETGELLSSTPNQPIALREEFEAASKGPWSDDQGRTYELQGKNAGPSLFPRVVRKDADGIERVVAATPWYLWPVQGVFPAFLMLPAGMAATMAGIVGLILLARKPSAAPIPPPRGPAVG